MTKQIVKDCKNTLKLCPFEKHTIKGREKQIRNKIREKQLQTFRKKLKEPRDTTCEIQHIDVCDIKVN